jgi:NADPH:quinone reductase-like Zn-dependent oxidoreductase
MRAIVKMKSGPPEVLRLREVEKSRPKLNEVLIQIRPATVTCGDMVMRRLPEERGKFAIAPL